MTQTMQDEFEADYCAHAHRLPALVKNCRLSNGSYGDPCIAKAWHWFKRSLEMLVVELPPAPDAPDDPEEAIDDSHMDAYHSAIGMRHACAKFIEAAGMKVKA